MIVWVDGGLVAERDARLSPFDHGLLVGDGVFETVRVYGGELFAWSRHLDRLARSAEGLGLAVPDRDVLRAAADDVLRANALREARVRITVTGGRAPLGSERGDGAPTVVVAASDLRPWAPSTDVVVVPWPRNERGALAGLKTISYAENVRALAFAQDRGAGEAIFANTRDELCEATGSNVFVVHDGRVSTPPGSSGCLLGVTRALVLELCPALGIAVEEVTLPVDALRHADEAFLTSTVREVQPIAHVDGVALPSTSPGAPGGVTARLAEAFTALVARDLDP
ncbi:MAG TPA: aminotransferase class IV [Acidimicrobiia bacterium]|nr:aminotransferase class IV [Acidimicrobiia bacterium]